MKRVNKAIPLWKDDRWVYRPSVEGRQVKITSLKEGKTGYNECLKKESLMIADKGNIRFETAWNKHLANRKKLFGEQSESYIKTESIGRIHILPMLQYKKLSHITDQDYQNCILNAKSDKVEQLSKKTLSNIKSEIMLFNKFAMKNQWVTRLPFDLEIPRTAPVIGKDILLPKALICLLADSDGDWYVNVWRFLVVTGLRPGEAYGLQWSDIKNNVISIRRSIDRRSNITSGKNENALRTLYATRIATRILNDQKHQLNENGLDTDWIFCDKWGDKPKPVNVYNHWYKYRNKYLGNVTPYGLRHTFVSITKSDLPDALLKQTVGHSMYMDTVGTYGHEIEYDKFNAATIIDKVFEKYESSTFSVPEENEKV